MKASTIVFLFGLGRCIADGWMYEEQYRGDYKPEVVNGELGPQIVAPDTPYVAAAGSRKLYFIDTRRTAEDAAYIKEQIEQAFVPKPNRRIDVDAETGLVHNIDSTGKVLFTFDPAYARVFFANLLNDLDPDRHVPVPDPAGDQLVTYDLESGEKVRMGEKH